MTKARADFETIKHYTILSETALNTLDSIAGSNALSKKFTAGSKNINSPAEFHADLADRVSLLEMACRTSERGKEIVTKLLSHKSAVLRLGDMSNTTPSLDGITRILESLSDTQFTRILMSTDGLIGCANADADYLRKRIITLPAADQLRIMAVPNAQIDLGHDFIQERKAKLRAKPGTNLNLK